MRFWLISRRCPQLLYQVLQVLREETVSTVNAACTEGTPYGDDGIMELNNQASRPEILAIHPSRRPGRLCPVPADRPESRGSSVWPQ